MTQEQLEGKNQKAR